MGECVCVRTCVCVPFLAWSLPLFVNWMCHLRLTPVFAESCIRSASSRVWNSSCCFFTRQYLLVRECNIVVWRFNNQRYFVQLCKMYMLWLLCCGAFPHQEQNVNIHRSGAFARQPKAIHFPEVDIQWGIKLIPTCSISMSLFYSLRWFQIRAQQKGKLTREGLLCWVRLCCKAIEFLCCAAGKEEEEIVILKLIIPFCQCLICKLFMTMCKKKCLFFFWDMTLKTFSACCWKHKQSCDFPKNSQ